MYLRLTDSLSKSRIFHNSGVGIFNGINASSSHVPFHDSNEKELIFLLSSMDKRREEELDCKVSKGYGDEEESDIFEERSGKLSDRYLSERDLKSKFICDSGEGDFEGNKVIEWGAVFGITQNKCKLNPTFIRLVLLITI